MRTNDSEITSPFVRFDTATWASFKHSADKLTLTEDDLNRCLAFNDKITLEDVNNVYMPLSSLLRMYYLSRHDRLAIIQQFLGSPMDSVPFIISISGSVSVGKTTTAKLLYELIKAWPCKPKVSLITTDGFLYPNAYLEERQMMGKKGFPASYDVKRLMQFLIDAKEGKKELKVPVYSHLTYDIVPDKFTIVDRPNVIIIEGVNVLQDGTEYPEFRKKAFISDYIDYSIYVDASEKNLMKTIILNGSPRKNWNTAMMLKEAKRGAESAGAETEYIRNLSESSHGWTKELNIISWNGRSA